MVITGGLLVLGFQDALIKASSTYTSYWQFLAIRSTLTLILVVLFSLIFFLNWANFMTIFYCCI